MRNKVCVMKVVGSLIININIPKLNEIIKTYLELGYAIKITPFKSVEAYAINILSD